MYGKKKGRSLAIGVLSALQGILVSCATMEQRALSYIEKLPEPRQPETFIAEREIVDLPPVVQHYFRFSQVIGKPR